MEIALCRFTSGTPREALDALDAGGWDLLSKAHGKNPDESPENCHGKIWKNWRGFFQMTSTALGNCFTDLG